MSGTECLVKNSLRSCLSMVYHLFAYSFVAPFVCTYKPFFSLPVSHDVHTSLNDRNLSFQTAHFSCQNDTYKCCACDCFAFNRILLPTIYNYGKNLKYSIIL